jgi:ABC-type phosphate/phosphonate transport system substrate-binding protein
VSFVAALAMYDWPETHADVDAQWNAIRHAFPRPDILAEQLSRADTLGNDLCQWGNPALVLGQTCWGPLSAGLVPDVQVLAQPDYSQFLGGQGPYYRSAIVARTGQAQTPPNSPESLIPAGIFAGAQVAANDLHSLSGHLALVHDLGGLLPGFGATIQWTGGHRASVRAVVTGAADIAAVDCRSWDMACRFEPGASGLIVVGWTAQRFGLPYICARSIDDVTASDMAKTLISLGAFPLAS